MTEDEPDVDWSLTTWEGSRQAQLRRALRLTLRERMEAMAGLADVARRFEEIRARGGFKAVSVGAKAPGCSTPSPPS